MNLHEYQGKEILNSFGVQIQRGIVATTAAEAVAAAGRRSSSDIRVECLASRRARLAEIPAGVRRVMASCCSARIRQACPGPCFHSRQAPTRTRPGWR